MRHDTFSPLWRLGILLPFLCAGAAPGFAAAQTGAPPDSSVVPSSLPADSTRSVNKCTGLAALWCRYRAHHAKVEQRRHYDAGWCAAYHTVTAADGAVGGFTGGAIAFLLLRAASAPAVFSDLVLIGAPLVGAILAYNAPERERECQPDPIPSEPGADAANPRAAARFRGPPPTAAPPKAPGR